MINQIFNRIVPFSWTFLCTLHFKCFNVNQNVSGVSVDRVSSRIGSTFHFSGENYSIWTAVCGIGNGEQSILSCLTYINRWGSIQVSSAPRHKCQFVLRILTSTFRLVVNIIFSFAGLTGWGSFGASEQNNKCLVNEGHVHSGVEYLNNIQLLANFYRNRKMPCLHSGIFASSWNGFQKQNPEGP